ncbi:MAG: hypothetical protein RL839_14020 [Gammaproteobacteria bacterium]
MLCVAFTGLNAAAQESSDSVWNGEWIAEGTLFRIGVSVEDGVMTVVQIESLGQIWSSQEGTIEGNIANVEVQYLGATGVIQAELIDENTAILHAASCAPDFMVVCTLSRDRQAIFKKVGD